MIAHDNTWQHMTTLSSDTELTDLSRGGSLETSGKTPLGIGMYTWHAALNACHFPGCTSDAWRFLSILDHFIFIILIIFVHIVSYINSYNFISFNLVSYHSTSFGFLNPSISRVAKLVTSPAAQTQVTRRRAAGGLRSCGARDLAGAAGLLW